VIGRAFVAVEPPAATLDAVQAIVDRVAPSAPDLRWLPREQWHITLQFLGAVADEDALVERLAAALAPLTAPTVALAGGGAFPKVARGGVLWLAVADGADALADVARAVHDATAALGHETEDRPFRPHLTVARARRPRDHRGLVDAIGAATVGSPWTVTEVVLYESDTRPEGAVHHERARIAVGA